MTTLRLVVSVLVTFVAVSEAFILPHLGAVGALAGAAATVPVLIGGKILLIPKALAIKAGIGMLGASMTGAELLKQKMLVSGPLVGAAAGFKAATLLQDPQQTSNVNAVSVQNVYGGLPAVQTLQPMPVIYPNYQASLRIPSVPIPSVQWYQQPINLNLPRFVFPPPQNKVITISKQITPAVMQPPSVVPLSEEKETETRTY